jgi:hypothetical protein
MRRDPHYLRFARALAFVSGLAAPGCYETHARSASTDAASDPGRDGGRDVGGDPCDLCYCPDFDDPDGRPACSWEDPETSICCPVVGPLSPPDLPA